jgi:hypothetical protein
MLEGILDHLSCNIGEHEVGFGLANSIDQMKMFLHAKGELNSHVKVKNN